MIEVLYRLLPCCMHYIFTCSTV